MLAPWKESHDQPRQHIKKQRHYFANKDPSSQRCGFSRPASWEICMQIKKQQLEPDMEQQTGSKLGKEYIQSWSDKN